MCGGGLLLFRPRYPCPIDAADDVPSGMFSLIGLGMLHLQVPSLHSYVTQSPRVTHSSQSSVHELIMFTYDCSIPTCAI